MQHKFSGDTAYANAEYSSAVHEYSLAIEHSAASFEAYKARGDAYSKYLLSPDFPRFTGYTGASLLKRRELATNMLCDAMSADYSKAETILVNSLNALNSELGMLKFNMSNEKTIFRVNDDVKPYYGKSAQKTIDMMQYRQLGQSQRNAILQKRELDKSVSGYKDACNTADYIAHRDRIKAAIERGRGSNWVKYGETGEAGYYFDKTSVKPLKGFVLATTRRERNSDNYHYDIASVKLNCKTHSLDKVERTGYEDIAGVAVKSSSTQPERDLAGPTTATDQLTRKLCR